MKYVNPSCWSEFGRTVLHSLGSPLIDRRLEMTLGDSLSLLSVAVTTSVLLPDVYCKRYLQLRTCLIFDPKGFYEILSVNIIKL